MTVFPRIKFMYHRTFIAHLGIYKNKCTKLVALHCPINRSYVQLTSVSVCFTSSQYEQIITFQFIQLTYPWTEIMIHYWSCANNSLGIPPNQATEWRWQHSLYKPYKKSRQQKSSVSSLMIFRKYGKTSTKKKKYLGIFINDESSIFFHWMIHGFGGKLYERLCTFTHGMYSVFKKKEREEKYCHLNVS